MPAQKKNLDFRGVKDRGNFRIKHFPEGDYRAKIIDVGDHESDNGDGWVYTIQCRNAKFPYYVMTYDKKQLWKVRNLFVAAGMKVPKKMLSVDPNKVVGKDIGVTLEDDEYEGRLRSIVADVLPVSELVESGDDEYDEEVDEEIEDEDDIEEDEEEEPEPPKKKKKATKKKAVEEDDEDEEVDDEELEELEVDEL